MHRLRRRARDAGESRRSSSGRWAVRSTSRRRRRVQAEASCNGHCQRSQARSAQAAIRLIEPSRVRGHRTSARRCRPCAASSAARWSGTAAPSTSPCATPRAPKSTSRTCAASTTATISCRAAAGHGHGIRMHRGALRQGHGLHARRRGRAPAPDSRARAGQCHAQAQVADADRRRRRVRRHGQARGLSFASGAGSWPPTSACPGPGRA